MTESISRKTIEACTRVRAGDAAGSGTVLYSTKNKDGTCSTFILTNEHVVDGAIKIEKKWHPVLKRNIEQEVTSTVEVDFFSYRWEQRVVGAQGIQADIVAWDKEEDLALLKLRSDDPAKSVAKMYPKGAETKLRIGMPTLVIGAAMGEPPVLTSGRLSRYGQEIENREYWLQTAPTIFGNSGGAAFLENTEEFIGVPARIAVVMLGFSADAITHLSYIIPITRVYKFLDEQMFRFVYDSEFTEEGEAKAREDKRKQEELRIVAKSQLGTDDAPEKPTPEQPKRR